MTDTLDVLKAAYHLLDDKKHWTQWTAARDTRGVPVKATSKTAVEWCAAGAIEAKAELFQSRNDAWDRLDKLSFAMYGRDISWVNDELGYRQARAVYRRAIRELETSLVQEPPQ